nr:DNA-directed RNA polymerases II, IV and V subunit 3-like [Ipomoea trifida]
MESKEHAIVDRKNKLHARINYSQPENLMPPKVVAGNNFEVPRPSSSPQLKASLTPFFYAVGWRPHRFCSSRPYIVVVDAEAYTYDDEVLKKIASMDKPGLIEIHAKEDIASSSQSNPQKLDAVRLSKDRVEADDQFGELGAHMRGGKSQPEPDQRLC